MTTNACGHKLVLKETSADVSRLNLQIDAMPAPTVGEGWAVVRVQAAAVNPSDVKAAMGAMPHAVWPRTPGRDYAGVVVKGPPQWVNQAVWGTGGDLGMVRDGTHASYLVLPVGALAHKPKSVSIAAAATVGVPFVTAYEGLRRAGLRGSGQRVLVCGAHGKVGQAAIQLATRAGAQVVGIERHVERYAGHASSAVRMLRAEDPQLQTKVSQAFAGRGADIVYNTVGSPYFAFALNALGVGGTQVLISTIARSVPFDILAFYRRNLQLLGVDSLKLDAQQCTTILRALCDGFESGQLRAFDVDETALWPLEAAAEAYRKVMAGSAERIVLAP